MAEANAWILGIVCTLAGLMVGTAIGLGLLGRRHRG